MKGIYTLLLTTILLIVPRAAESSDSSKILLSETEANSKAAALDPGGNKYFKKKHDLYNNKKASNAMMNKIAYALNSLKEPSLTKADRSERQREYRFVYVPNFMKCLSIRIYEQSGHYFMRIARSNGKGELELSGTMTIGKKSFERIVSFFEKQEVHRPHDNLSQKQEAYLSAFIGGPEWVFEGIDKKGHFLTIANSVDEFRLNRDHFVSLGVAPYPSYLQLELLVQELLQVAEVKLPMYMPQLTIP